MAKKTRQEKARRILEIATRRMLRQLKARGLKSVPDEDELVRELYHDLVGLDRLARAWDLASIVA